MRIIGLLSWFDESPTWLAATVASLKGVCDAVVAVDGRYDLYPGDRPSSGPEQQQAIAETASACGLETLIYTPTRPWRGNEIEKRNAMFEFAERIAVPGAGDWYLIIDADERVTAAPDRDALADMLLDADCANVTLWWHNDPDRIGANAITFEIPQDAETVVPRLYNADLPLRYDGWHGNVTAHRELDAAVESGLRLEHRHAHRDLWRRRQQGDYIVNRQREGAEQLPVAPET